MILRVLIIFVILNIVVYLAPHQKESLSLHRGLMFDSLYMK